MCWSSLCWRLRAVRKTQKQSVRRTTRPSMPSRPRVRSSSSSGWSAPTARSSAESRTTPSSGIPSRPSATSPSVNKDAAAARTRCTAFQFTKAVGRGQPPAGQGLVVGRDPAERALRLHSCQWLRLPGGRSHRRPVLQGGTGRRPADNMSRSVILEEATLVPAGTATVTLTATPLNANGTPAASIVTTFTCRG